jgi:ABC-2 type transport system ATP-binding protein
METVLKLTNVSKSFKDFELKNISFSLEPGYIMGFIGPNGAGKTTTIKLIMNLLRLNYGQIEVFGQDHVSFEKSIKDRIGFIYDECHFFDHLSIINNAKILGPFYSQWNESIFLDYLKRFELDPKKRLKKLSKGMKTKFQLAFALSHQADLLIMDEPTAGLDPIFRREFLDLLYELIQDEQKSIFFSTHITSDLDKVADYVTYINHGEIVFSESIESIKDTYRIVKGSNELINTLGTKALIGIKQTAYGFEALTNNSKHIKDIYGDSIVFEMPTLEDLMIFSKEGILK